LKIDNPSAKHCGTQGQKIKGTRGVGEGKGGGGKVCQKKKKNGGRTEAQNQQVVGTDKDQRSNQSNQLSVGY